MVWRNPRWLILVALLACTSTSTATTTSTVATSTTTTMLMSTSTSTSPTSTTTTSSTTTTTEPDYFECLPDPFTDEFVQQITDKYPGIRITAHVHDLRSDCGYSMNRDARNPTASVFKVMVMAGTLLEAQNAERPPTDYEINQMTPMITESANSPVRSLWRSFGSSPWFREQGEIFGLRETSISADGGSAWGRTTTSALDQVNLLRQVLVGDWGPLDDEYRAIALDLMTSVVPDQTWGVTAGVPDDWVVAQKNGFAGVTANSVGWVDEPGESEGYVVAILTTGWSNWRNGVAAIEEVSAQVAGIMTSGAG